MGRVDGLEVLLPGMLNGGRDLSPEEAQSLYLKNGQHLGIFRSAQDADRWSQMLHQQQALHYQPGIPHAIMPQTPVQGGSVNVGVNPYRGPAGYPGPVSEGSGMGSLGGLFQMFSSDGPIGEKAEVDRYVAPPKMDYWVVEKMKREHPEDLPSTYSVMNQGSKNWIK